MQKQKDEAREAARRKELARLDAIERARAPPRPPTVPSAPKETEKRKTNTADDGGGKNDELFLLIISADCLLVDKLIGKRKGSAANGRGSAAKSAVSSSKPSVTSDLFSKLIQYPDDSAPPAAIHK